MKLKCNDGRVRRFEPSYKRADKAFGEYDEGRCVECDASFGVHDLAVLKPMFKAHKCTARPLSVGLRMGGAA